MSRSKVLQLYKSIISESHKFSDYNFRSYALRRARDAFKENKTEEDPEKIRKFLSHGRKNLEIIKRQVSVGQLFGAERHGGTKRNFRSAFYGRVGVRVVEEKKALENLLKDDTIDIKKLSNFCSFHPLPAMYRVSIWKILLGILPVNQQSHKFVMRQRCEQYEDLYHALKVMRKIDEKTTQPDIFLRAYVLEIGKYGLCLYHEKWHDLFLDIAAAVSKMTDDLVDGYWLSVGIYKKFTKFFETNEEHELEFSEIFSSVLKKENPKLFDHLTRIHALKCLPYKLWFVKCYAGTLLPEGGLERIWDVLISGFFSFLPFVAVQILLTVERRLLRIDNLTRALDILNEVPYTEEVGEMVACKAVDLWQRHSERGL